LKGKRESRLDPNFYRLDFRTLSEKIRKNNVQRLGEIVKFSSESWNQEDFFDDTFPYIEISEIDIVSGEIKSVSEILINEAPSRAKMIVRENDIIISTTRPNRGAIAKINKQINFSIASTGFAVIRTLKTDKISKDFLFFALRQNFSLSQMEQRSSGGSYPAITQEELSNLLIPVPSKETQQTIINIFEKAYALKKANEEKAKVLLASIDDYLLAELGIVLPEKVENSLKNRVFLRKFNSVCGGRFDSYFYQEYFFTLLRNIENGLFECQPINQIAQFKAGYAFKSEDYIDVSDCHLITIKNIKKNVVSLDNCSFLPDEFYFQYSNFQVKKNDLLIAMTGATIGKVGIYSDDKMALLNQRNGIINSKKISSHYLMEVLNLAIFQSLILRNSNGGAQPNISETDIMSIRIPLPLPEIQEKIVAEITNIRQQAKTLQNEAKTAIEEAKRTVEAMILG